MLRCRGPGAVQARLGTVHPAQEPPAVADPVEVGGELPVQLKIVRGGQDGQDEHDVELGAEGPAGGAEAGAAGLVDKVAEGDALEGHGAGLVVDVGRGGRLDEDLGVAVEANPLPVGEKSTLCQLITRWNRDPAGWVGRAWAYILEEKRQTSWVSSGMLAAQIFSLSSGGSFGNLVNFVSAP